MKNRVFIKKILPVMLAVLLLAGIAPAAVFAEPDAYGHEAQWWNFRNSQDNNSVTDRPTPVSSDEAWEKWGVSFGSGFNAAPTPPIIVDNKLYIGKGNQILELDKETGKVLRESSAMPGTIGYAMFPPLYAEGKIFVTITNSRICAVDIDTLKVAWVTDNSGIKKKGQTVSPLSYKKINGTGYLCTGTWTNPGGDLICVTCDDSDLTAAEGAEYPVKKLAWIFDPDEADAENLQKNESVAKGYYWTGAYMSEKYLAIGSDNGEGMSDAEAKTAFYTLDPVTGEIIDAVYRIGGQVRSTVVYHEGCLYFSTKGAKVYKIPVSENGDLGEPSFIDLGSYGAITSSSTVVVHKGKIYLGLSGKGGKLSTDGGHGFMVIRDDEVLSQDSYLYTISVPGYPQMGALLSTFHEEEDYDGDGNPDGRVYLYFTYNASPGGIYYTWDTPDQTEATELTTDEARIFVPSPKKQNYCISPIIVDEEGTLYYKNDSGYLFAVESNAAELNGLEVYEADGTRVPFDSPFRSGLSEYSLVASPEAEKLLVKLSMGKDTTATVNETPCSEKGTQVLLDDGETEVRIAVTRNGKSRVYTLRVQKAGVNADLSLLASAIRNGPTQGSRRLTPDFDKNVTEYTIDWRTDGTGKSTDPALSKMMNLFLKTESDKATVKVWPIENVDVSKGKVLEDGSVPFYTVSSSLYDKRFPVYSADVSKDSVVRVEVTAQDGKTVKNYRVTFSRRIYVTQVSLDTTEAELSPGDRLSLHAEVRPLDATDKTIIWSSSDEKIAVVDEDGNVTALREGEVEITAASEDGPADVCRLTIEGHELVPVKKADPSLEQEGYTRDCYRCIYCDKFFADEDATEELPAEEIVIPPIQKLSVSFTLEKTSYVYDGKEKKPAVKNVKAGGRSLKKSEYKVSYSAGRKKVGTYQVTVSLTGNYMGSKTQSYTILPKGTALSSVKGISKGFTVTWKKQTKETTGYQIQYSTNKKFASGNKTVLITKNTTNSKTIGKLKKGRIYYVRIRTYKTVSGKKYFSSWSAVKKVKTK